MAAQGGQGTQLQDSGALVHEQASTRSGAGLPSLAQSCISAETGTEYV